MSAATSSRPVNAGTPTKTLDFATLAAHLIRAAPAPAATKAATELGRADVSQGDTAMEIVRGIVIWGVISLGAATIAGVLAGVKNRDYSFWIAWCFLVPPLVLFLLLLPRYQGPRPRRPSLDEQERGGGW
jgi:hypothetical protein